MEKAGAHDSDSDGEARSRFAKQEANKRAVEEMLDGMMPGQSAEAASEDEVASQEEAGGSKAKKKAKGKRKPKIQVRDLDFSPFLMSLRLTPTVQKVKP